MAPDTTQTSETEGRQYEEWDPGGVDEEYGYCEDMETEAMEEYMETMAARDSDYEDRNAFPVDLLQDNTYYLKDAPLNPHDSMNPADCLPGYELILYTCMLKVAFCCISDHVTV